jgi:hypothetical protein
VAVALGIAAFVVPSPSVPVVVPPPAPIPHPVESVEVPARAACPAPPADAKAACSLKESGSRGQLSDDARRFELNGCLVADPFNPLALVAWAELLPRRPQAQRSFLERIDACPRAMDDEVARRVARLRAKLSGVSGAEPRPAAPKGTSAEARVEFDLAVLDADPGDLDARRDLAARASVRGLKLVIGSDAKGR